MITSIYPSTDRAVLKTNAFALTDNFDAIAYYQAIELSKSVYKIQEVQIRFYRYDKIEIQKTKHGITNSTNKMQKLMDDLTVQMRLEHPCREILYCSSRYYSKPFIGLFMVLASGVNNKVIEVMQHISLQVQDHWEVHSEHFKASDAITQAKQLYYNQVNNELASYHQYQQEQLQGLTLQQFILSCAKQIIENDLEWFASNNLVAI